MKLLLTSGGLTNVTLRKAFIHLLPKEHSKIKVAFIPTAANVYPDTSWLENDIENLRKCEVGSICMVDLAKLTPQESLKLCIDSDVIWLNGGNTYFLLEWVRKSGLGAELGRLLQDRIYVGVSAGSMIAGPTIETNTPFFPEEDENKIEDMTGLNLVPYAIIPHLFSSSFPNASPNCLERFAARVSYPIYALDDASAMLVIDGKRTIVSEGEVREYNCA